MQPRVVCMWPVLWLRSMGTRGRLESSHLAPAFPGTRGELTSWGVGGPGGQGRLGCRGKGSPGRRGGVRGMAGLGSGAVEEVLLARVLQRNGTHRVYVCVSL